MQPLLHLSACVTLLDLSKRNLRRKHEEKQKVQLHDPWGLRTSLIPHQGPSGTMTTVNPVGSSVCLQPQQREEKGSSLCG